ncbi:hypothetical protein HDU80_004181 [Chytriomyces hyalinus]|nr:hypothetical protein HDU80_004181 [Chytriomyces hyalinus]
MVYGRLWMRTVEGDLIETASGQAGPKPLKVLKVAFVKASSDGSIGDILADVGSMDLLGHVGDI